MNIQESYFLQPRGRIGRGVFIIILMFSFATILSQEKQKPITLNGYLTTMQSAIFNSLSDPFLFENLLHNRLNFRGYAGENVILGLEIRNRLFTGDLVRMGPVYSEAMNADPGLADLTWNLLERQSFILNSTVDRFWIDLHFNRIQVTAGRQRINWGQALVWNPNDIFNAYSFFDFDYIERPGSDAVRVQFFPSPSSAAELAVKADSENDVTAAGLFRFNKWGYDIQFLAGLVNSEDVVIGTGWSGTIGSLSFRGEGSWFSQYEEFPNTTGMVIVTAGIDKVFSNNSLAQIQLMYCNNPIGPEDFLTINSRSLSAKDLAFSRFSAFGQVTWAATPLLNMTISGMWFPDLDGYFTGPSLDFSIAENLDFSLVWQHFNAEMAGIKQRLNLGFLRIKYSF